MRHDGSNALLAKGRGIFLLKSDCWPWLFGKASVNMMCGSVMLPQRRHTLLKQVLSFGGVLTSPFLLPSEVVPVLLNIPQMIPFTDVVFGT